MEPSADALPASTLPIRLVLARISVAEGLAVAAIILGLGIRLVGLPHAPLWIDETFTAAIASQPTLGGVLKLARLDAPPSTLYYVLIHFWQLLAGNSDDALRFPSLCFSAATPLLIAFCRVPGLTRTERLAWAALLALWVPGIGFAMDARCYAMLFLVSTLETLAFCRMMRAPGLRTALLWMLAADLMIATNYDGAFMALMQGLIFLATRRQAALRTWPAALLLLPVCAEIAWKLPILLHMEQAGSAWYPILRAVHLFYIYVFALSGVNLGGFVWLFAFPLLLLGTDLAGRGESRPADPARITLHWAAGAALLGCCTLLLIGFFRPVFTYRYLTSFEPGLLLGVVLVLRALGPRIFHVSGAILVTLAVVGCGLWLVPIAAEGKSNASALNIEQASGMLMRDHVHDVLFAWDTPTARAMAPHLLRTVGGFFFHRAGLPVHVVSMPPPATSNPNVAVPKAAARTGAAFILLYDTSIRETASTKYPPDLARLSVDYRCRHFGRQTRGSIACVPKTSPR